MKKITMVAAILALVFVAGSAFISNKSVDDVQEFHLLSAPDVNSNVITFDAVDETIEGNCSSGSQSEYCSVFIDMSQESYVEKVGSAGRFTIEVDLNGYDHPGLATDPILDNQNSKWEEPE